MMGENMSEAKHTTGPWINDNGLVYGTSGDGTPSFDIYYSADWPGDADEGMANAKLIAAAPDLLEALPGVVRVADRATDEFDVARAAIRKATQ